MSNAETGILERTLAAAIKDEATVTPEGTPLHEPIAGVEVRPLPTHFDTRGSVTELFDERWNHPHPLVFAYTFMIRPGVVKGWSLHKQHQDRYVVLHGALELVLFDPRPDSLTRGKVWRTVLSGEQRTLINIPEFVWHADRNVGTNDLVVVNFPTIPYDHQNPDKYRLPLDTPLIPYRFPPGTQGG